MKLRIEAGSVRFRLKQGEVAQLAASGRVEEVLRFGPAPGEQLVYVLEASEAGAALDASYRDGRLTVRVPAAQARAWAESEEAGLEGTYAAASGETVRLLVEKDFQCLHRESADPGAFPHPEARQADASMTSRKRSS